MQWKRRLPGLSTAVALMFLSHFFFCAADEVVTPDKAEYADKITKEMEQLSLLLNPKQTGKKLWRF